MKIRLKDFRKFPKLKLRYVSFDASGRAAMLGGKFER